MQQIFNFIYKNSYKMLFLLLLGISLFSTVQSHSYHRSQIINSANFLSGGVYEEMHNISEYLNLKTQNDALAQENAKLRSLLLNIKDTALVPKSSDLMGMRPNDIIVSKIIHNTYNTRDNYLTLNSGSLQGVKVDMGVINSLGIVGIVDNISPNYATVISVLNTKFLLNAKIKKSDHFGSLIWDGKDPGYVQLIDVPRLVAIKKGDTIVTGGQSVIFPENINIGTVDKKFVDNQTHNYTLNIKLFNDMTNLGHVYILKSKNREEIINLEKRKKNE